MSNVCGGQLSKNGLHLQQAIVTEWVNKGLCPVWNVLLANVIIIIIIIIII